MHEQEFAIVRALVPVAWADGDFADKEKEMLEALLDAYGANDGEKQQLRDYAKEKRRSTTSICRTSRRPIVVCFSNARFCSRSPTANSTPRSPNFSASLQQSCASRMT